MMRKVHNDVPVGILCHEQENLSPHMQSLHHIILEGNIVMDVVESLPQAMGLHTEVYLASLPASLL
ncbi:unnamed protein product [Arctogadus glacialis]